MFWKIFEITIVCAYTFAAILLVAIFILASAL